MISDLTKVVESGAKIVDDVNYSGEERAAILTERHKTDMSSDSWLSKNIRPMTLLFLLVCQASLIVGWFMGIPTEPFLAGQIGTLLFGAFSFYFNSKKGERIAEKNAKANLQLNKEKLNHELEVEKMRLKEEAKKDRALRRLERIKARRS